MGPWRVLWLEGLREGLEGVELSTAAEAALLPLMRGVVTGAYGCPDAVNKAQALGYDKVSSLQSPCIVCGNWEALGTDGGADEGRVQRGEREGRRSRPGNHAPSPRYHFLTCLVSYPVILRCPFSMASPTLSACAQLVSFGVSVWHCWLAFVWHWIAY